MNRLEIGLIREEFENTFELLLFPPLQTGCAFSRVSIDRSRWYQQAASVACRVCEHAHACAYDKASFNSYSPAPLIVKWITPCVQTEREERKAAEHKMELGGCL